MHWRTPISYSIDTRTLNPGDIFIPVKGPNFDGHDFITDAIKKGASKIIDEDIGKYAAKYRKKLNATVIGITGSYGKTTVKDMLYYALKPYFNVVRTKENQNNEIGAPLTLLNANANTDIILVEMGTRKKGDIQYLTRIVRPSISIITGIGHSHQVFFKTQRAIATEKSSIFLPKLKWEPTPRHAYICQHSDQIQILKEKAKKTGHTIYTYGGQTGFDDNMALCYAIGQHFGLTQNQIESGLEHYTPSKNRLNTRQHHNITIIDDTYNSNPHGVRYALHYLNHFSGRKICILGDMLELGKESVSEHQKLAEPLLDISPSAIFTIGTDIKKLNDPELPILHCTTKKELHQAILAELKPGDTLLIKGSRSLELDETVQYIETHYHA